jgi:hypothetical protein
VDQTVCEGVRNLPAEQISHTQNPSPPVQITVPPDAPPFTQVAMDLITGLLKSRGYDSILTIVNYGCSQGALFLPCQSTITGPQIAKLYYQHLYPWFGLPRHIITDRDPRFTSHFGRALAKELGITWNLSAGPSPTVNHSPGILRLDPYPIRRDKRTWRELLEATPGPDSR